MRANLTQEGLRELSDVDRITHRNAMTHFSYEPFPIFGGRSECTVGALRARAADHDVSTRSVAPGMVGAHAALSTDLSVPGNR